MEQDPTKPFLSGNDFNKHSVGIMLEQFTATCKIHTSVMMYKYQLEQYLLMKESCHHLYTITAALEGTANLLQTIEVMTIFLKVYRQHSVLVLLIYRKLPQDKYVSSFLQSNIR